MSQMMYVKGHAPEGRRYVLTTKSQADIAIMAYLGQIIRKIQRGENITGRTVLSASRGRIPKQFSGSSFYAGRNVTPTYVIKRVTSQTYIVFDQDLEIPMTKPCSLDEACVICQNMNDFT